MNNTCQQINPLDFTVFWGVLVAVRQAREAALDAQLLVVATDLGKEKASQLFSEGTAFDPTAFAEHLVSMITVSCLSFSHLARVVHTDLAVLYSCSISVWICNSSCTCFSFTLSYVWLKKGKEGKTKLTGVCLVDSYDGQTNPSNHELLNICL